MNPKWGNLGKCGLEGTKWIPAEFLIRAPRLTPGLGWFKSALGSSNSSCSTTNVISLKHALIPSAKANQHSILSQNLSCYYPKQQEPSKVELTTLSQNPRNDSLKIF